MRNKIPKEIYPCIFAGDRLWFEQEHWFTQDGKYLSEEHFNSLIEEKDKEIERLKAFTFDIYRRNANIFEEVDLPTQDLYKIRRSLNISKEF